MNRESNSQETCYEVHRPRSVGNDGRYLFTDCTGWYCSRHQFAAELLGLAVLLRGRSNISRAVLAFYCCSHEYFACAAGGWSCGVGAEGPGAAHRSDCGSAAAGSSDCAGGLTALRELPPQIIVALVIFAILIAVAMLSGRPLVNKEHPAQTRKFARLAISNVLLVYFLMLLGSYVSTGDENIALLHDTFAVFVGLVMLWTVISALR